MSAVASQVLVPSMHIEIIGDVSVGNLALRASPLAQSMLHGNRTGKLSNYYVIQNPPNGMDVYVQDVYSRYSMDTSPAERIHS